MREIIAAKQLPLGDTQAGKDWCLKALHPADPLTTLDGIPDEDSHCVVVQNFTQNITLTNPEPDSAGNWDADIFFYPHPYLIGAIRTVSAGGATTWSSLTNSQIAGTTAAQKSATFTGMCERYRLAYMGITGYHNASAIENNGMVTVAQYQETPMTATIETLEVPTQLKAKQAVGIQAVGASILARPVETWHSGPRTYDQLRQMPNAYSGNAREGVYAPFRLSRTHQQWQSSSDTVLHATFMVGGEFVGPYINMGLDDISYPYGLNGVSTTSWGVGLIHRRADEGVVHMSFKQLSQNAAFEFVFRSGWEMQVLPGSTFASFAKSSPLYDPVAIKNYFQVSREFKDAYPAEYNDLGKILEIIKGGLKAVMGHLIPFGDSVLNLIAGPGRRSPAAIGVTEQHPDLASAAQKERAIEARSAAPAPPRGPPPQRPRRPPPQPPRQGARGARNAGKKDQRRRK